MSVPDDAWPFIGVLVAFKAVTVAAILWFAVPWNDTTSFVWLHTAPFIVLVVALLVLGPGAFWLRLVRVRRKRGRLIAAEFKAD